MLPGHRAKSLARTAVSLLCLYCVATASQTQAATAKQQSLDHWRNLTSSNAAPPRVFVKGNHIRFDFVGASNIVEFSASWHDLRVPTDDYKVSSARLRRDRVLSRLPELPRGWSVATVIAGAEWRRLASNLLEVLAPKSPGHGASYQTFFADRLLFRDSQGVARLAPPGELPKSVIIDHPFTIEETLQILARQVEQHLVQNHPGDTLFLIMAPDATRFTQPLLLDRQRRQCVWLAPAALYDITERGLGFAISARGVGDFLVEGQGLALIKNPVSSIARLADLCVETAVQFLRLPLPRSTPQLPPAAQSNGMNLVQWEKWLDHYTGTRAENGSLQLLIDGDRFFPQLHQAITAATNHIHINVYIFDRDDVAVSVADQLRQRSSQLPVDVILDQMGSLAAGLAPPATPMPEDFVLPASINDYLKNGSQVRVHPFLNPWLSIDHSKIFLMDGSRAFVGGMNLGREYRYEWHDLMVDLQGPIVASLEKEFRRNWAHESLFGDLAYAVTLFSPSKPTPPPSGPGPWLRVRRLPTRTGWKPFNAAVRGSIHKAQSYIYVENPYLFDKRVIGDLVRARKRGVDVRVILPRVNDFKAGGRGNLVTANYLLQHGVRVYFYPGMTHVKALLVDGWSCVGSGNLNHISLHLSQEQNLATSNPEFAARLKQDLFQEDFDRSYELHHSISVDWIDFLADTALQEF